MQWLRMGFQPLSPWRVRERVRGEMMTEYANPIVNAAVKLGMNKKEALLMADNTAEIDF